MTPREAGPRVFIANPGYPSRAREVTVSVFIDGERTEYSQRDGWTCTCPIPDGEPCGHVDVARELVDPRCYKVLPPGPDEDDVRVIERRLQGRLDGTLGKHPKHPTIVRILAPVVCRLMESARNGDTLRSVHERR